MKLARRYFAAGEKIPVEGFLKERKLAKFFSRETAAAVTALGGLLAEAAVSPDVPAYYGIGVVEKESFGLENVVSASAGSDGKFSQKRFVDDGFMSVPPLNQFKVLYNMPLCFASIVFGLKGDNAVIYHSGRALLEAALLAPAFPVLLGAGKSYADGGVGAAFALAERAEVEALLAATGEKEAIDALTGGEGG